ncbi:formate dehydrogenase accessory sulfurtransferase FdhD [Fodinisporobacter ferrooxydans]|uniref:Sulfur carrier protein FdhD n=1 Tax=Fodinisporobacter ferrooxydans TaxID=2901836 RepID=A0ABY4CQH9_9BACL|nr:formate dehydrogenase accessory sulfurtransferase FdhD [Alicyclobacillaceae bacterium MYW30-H2]
MYPVVVSRQVISYKNGNTQNVSDEIATEYPLTIFLNDEEFATLVCTPEYLEDLVVGFLASEGVIRNCDEIKDVLVDENKGFVYVETHSPKTFSTKFYSKRYITSCCGKSRQSFYFFNDAKTAKKITDKTAFLTDQDCFRLMNEMQQDATTFQLTGGVHNAALCDTKHIILSRMDIGRHNALDKIFGYCLKNSISLQGKVIAFSGRISSEVLLKVAKIGCEIVLSKSAPTELALQMADELGITAVGFIRNDSFNVYTHHERICAT